MRTLVALTFLLAVLAGRNTQAQDASGEQIATMLVQDLSTTGSMEGGQWFTDVNNVYGLGVIYVHIPGSAGSVSIHAGLYGFLDSGWVKLRDVQGLFGTSPTDAAFFPGRVEVSTMMLGPDDPRCCPTKSVRWSIDQESGQAMALN